MSTVSDEKKSTRHTGPGPGPHDHGTSSTTRNRAGSGLDGRRTTIFVVVALACLLITGVFEWASQPAEIEEYGKVGQEFYPEFTDPTRATSLVVQVVDPEELTPLEFSVKQSDNGRWVIPSHHDYPADAEDQLAQTAASVIGIERGAMVTRWPSDHTRYGVVDPDTDSVGVDEIEGIGKRLTLRGPDDKVLASYIIGKPVEGEENKYYVRHPGEDETYIAELNINLSTRFADWVNTSLLDLSGEDIRRLVLNDYSFEERGPRLALTQTEVSTLRRESASDDWQLEDLQDESKEVNSEAVSETVNTLADLEIAGVRPKQPGLTSDLQLDRSVLQSQRDVDQLQSDLLARGFLLQPDQSNPELLRLIAREGEMSVGTDNGLVYQLHFGRVFTGSDQELEIGFSSNGEADPSSDEEDTDQEESESDKDTEDESESDDDSSRPGRYVFVRVDVDPTLLGDKPDPVKPEKPAELVELEKKVAEQKNSESDQPESDEASEEEAPSSSEEQTNEESQSDADDSEEETDKASSEETTGEDNSDAEPDDETRLKALQEEFEAAQQQYETELAAKADFEEQLKQAQEQAEELNRRFAQWYYVIPGESYDKLSLSRPNLIQEKTADEQTVPGGAPGEPTPQFNMQLPGGAAPGGLPPGFAPQPAPPQQETTAEETANDETSAEEATSEEDPAAETPAGDATDVEKEPKEETPEKPEPAEEETPESEPADTADEEAVSEVPAEASSEEAEDEAPEAEDADDEANEESETESDETPPSE